MHRSHCVEKTICGKALVNRQYFYGSRVDEPSATFEKVVVENEMCDSMYGTVDCFRSSSLHIPAVETDVQLARRVCE